MNELTETNRFWTPAEDAALRDHYERGKVTVRAVQAEHLPHRTVPAIMGRLRTIGLARKHLGPPKKFDHDTAILRQIFSISRYMAGRRGYSWKLTFGEFKQVVVRPCHYCGNELTNTHRGKDSHEGHSVRYTGIDRVDNDRGYEPDNIVPCCIVCNRMKHVLSYDQFVQHIKAIYERLQSEANTF